MKGGYMKSYCDFTASYTGFGGKSYISFTVAAEEEIVQYQAEMLAKNQIDFLLPLSVQRLNDNWKLSYEITSKIPLGKILERKSLKYEEFENIIKQIGRLSLKLKDYLLDIYSVVFDKSYIYCDPGDMSLYFIYFPVKTGSQDSSLMKKFLQKLIFEDIRLQDDSSGSLLKRLLDVLKSEMFTPEHLLNCLSSKQPENGDSINQSGIESYTVDKVFASPNKAISIKQDQEKTGEWVPKATPFFQEMAADKYEKSKKTIDTKYPLKSYIIAGIANMLLFVMLIYILFSKTGSRNIISTLSGLILIGFAINYFIYTRLFSENVQNQTEEAGKPVKTAYAGQITVEDTEEDIILPNRVPLYAKTWLNPDLKAVNERIGTDLVHRDNNSNEKETSGPEEPVLPERNDSENMSLPVIKLCDEKTIQDRTIILGYPSGNLPYLQSHSCPTERITIMKDSMLLGRLSDSVDYTIKNKAVGKIHAEIIKKEDSYYIIDLNSVNGTYINNERIACSTAVRLRNGDIVTLANESYTFVMN